MKSTKDITACVVDHGLFLPVARRLARDYAKVYYWSPWDKAFPTAQEAFIGDGFEDIERVDSPWRVKDRCDLFVFPDIGFAPMQAELRSQGMPVWGAGEGDTLETNRGKFLEALKRSGLPVPPHQAITGVSALREFLMDKEDRWVKVSKYRGDFETMHWRSWEEDEGTLDFYAVKFGPARDLITFYVFEPIESDIEDGYDGYCIDGQWPESCIHGMEAKDKAYLGTFQKHSKLPEEVSLVNEAFGPILADYNYRSFFSSEVRITEEKESFFIDPTCRCGSPPSQVMAELFANLGEIVWCGARGILVNPEPAAKFGVQGLVTLSRDKSSWGVMHLPEELDRWLKCGFSCKIGDNLCFPPAADLGNDAGWLVGVGDTIQEAIDHLKENSEQLPDGAHCEFSALADLLKEVHKAEESGMEFTPQEVPEPATILED